MEIPKCVALMAKLAKKALDEVRLRKLANPASSLLSVPAATLLYWGATLFFDFYSFGMFQTSYSISLDSYSLFFSFFI